MDFLFFYEFLAFAPNLQLIFVQKQHLLQEVKYYIFGLLIFYRTISCVSTILFAPVILENRKTKFFQKNVNFLL